VSVRPQLRARSLGNLLDESMPRREHLLHPWLREQESAMVWAAPGVGKTLFTLTLALAMAGGGEVMGWKAVRPRRVLIVDGEMPEDDLKDRLQGLLGAVDGIDLDAARGNLNILARHGQHADAEFLDLGDEAKQQAVIEQIRSYHPDVVILDNLSTLATIDDENGAAETQRLVKLLAKLKQAKIAVIAVHHSNKAGTDFRGSSMLATTFEVIIGLTREKGAGLLDPTGSAKFKLTWTKYRGRRSSAVADREMRLEDAGSGMMWTASTPEAAVLEAIAALVRTGNYATQAEVRDALPEHLWPTHGSAPAKSWMSKQFSLAAANGVLPRGEAEAFFRAARSDGSDLDEAAHDDF